MNLIDQYAEEIKKLCFQHRVKKLYAFGSVVNGLFNRESDIDLIVDFKPIELNQYADNYFELKFALEDTLKRKIDLLEEKTISNPYFKKAVEGHRQLIYAD
jgi:uncharacterized protein